LAVRCILQKSRLSSKVKVTGDKKVKKCGICPGVVLLAVVLVRHFFSAAVLWCAVLYAGGKISACCLVNLVSSTTECLFWLNSCQITVTHKAVVCFQHITVHCKTFSNFVYICHISTAIRKGRRRWHGRLDNKDDTGCIRSTVMEV